MAANPRGGHILNSFALQKVVIMNGVKFSRDGNFEGHF